MTAPARPRIMGILNVTPDSFSDGGRYASAGDAIAHGRLLVEQGADIVDVGGESTRPGARRVAPEQELDRVLPVVEALVDEGVEVSVDTMNSTTAAAAIAAGASTVNDVSGGLADPEMYRVIAGSSARYIAMHWRGHLSDPDALAHYDDVVVEVREELKTRLAEMFVWGIVPERIVLDPGIGFAKNADHNWAVLRGLPEFASLGCPLLIGTSRKRFLGTVLPDQPSLELRDAATATTSALAAEAGVWCVRVHDVPSTRLALDVWSAWRQGSAG